MFSLPELSEIDSEINKEKTLLSGAEFLNSSGELSFEGKKEVQEEINYCRDRIGKFVTLRQIVEILHNIDYKNRPNQFASEEVINEFKRLVSNAQTVVEDFKTPVQVDIEVKEI